MPLARSGLLLAAATAALLGVDCLRPPPRTVAADQNPFQDADGDLLPDSLEWTLLTNPGLADTDGDGTDDFLAAVQHLLPSGNQRVPPLDHEMRAVVSTTRGTDGQPHVIFNLLLRIVTGGATQVQSLTTFVDVYGSRMPLDNMVTTGVAYIVTRTDPVEGTYILMCSRIGSPTDLLSIVPCAIGAQGTIGQRSFLTGSVLVNVDATLSGIVPVSDEYFALHPCDPQFDGDDPFWQRAHTCELELVGVGSGGGSTVCQVTDANCTGAPTLLCAPSCSSWSGKLVVVPNGTTFLTGQ